jgi:hypothetical protein
LPLDCQATLHDALNATYHLTVRYGILKTFSTEGDISFRRMFVSAKWVHFARKN